MVLWYYIMVLLTFSPDTEVADMNMCLDCGGGHTSATLIGC